MSDTLFTIITWVFAIIFQMFVCGIGYVCGFMDGLNKRDKENKNNDSNV